MTTDTTTATELYQVYGIVGATAELPPEITTAATYRLLRHGTVAALVGGPVQRPPRVSRAALLDHAGLLDRVAVATAVLPARFGTVLNGPQEVIDMLAAHQHDYYTALQALHGRTQFTVKVQHIREAVLQEIVDEQPEATRLRDLLADETSGAGYYEQVRLGELVALALAAKCEADAVTLWEALTPHSAAAVPRDVTSPEAPFGGAFLVDNAHRAQFEAAAADLVRRWEGRARVRLLGPLAPYDFISSEPAPPAAGGR
ncbi:MAG TPA: GvpL/GvpF family gas vesicle protein [Actinoplanes sp.]|jgi:hypothetical protein